MFDRQTASINPEPALRSCLSIPPFSLVATRHPRGRMLSTRSSAKLDLRTIPGHRPVAFSRFAQRSSARRLTCLVGFGLRHRLSNSVEGKDSGGPSGPFRCRGNLRIQSEVTQMVVVTIQTFSLSALKRQCRDNGSLNSPTFPYSPSSGYHHLPKPNPGGRP